jgi:hypothetical protein
MSDGKFNKYEGLIKAMRDALYVDSKHIPLAINHDNSRDTYWYELHNVLVKEAEDEYERLFVESNETTLKNVSLEATGYDWLKYSSQEKYSLAGLIATSLELDKDKKDRIIRTLDLFYDRAIQRQKNIQEKAAADESLSLCCVDVIVIGVNEEAKTAKRK